MSHQTGGPATAAGKAVSSQNARKHGIRAQGFINETENSRFNTLLSHLQKSYGQQPLVNLQLTRLAKAMVQLERVEHVMDALYEKSKRDTQPAISKASVAPLASYPENQPLLEAATSELKALNGVYPIHQKLYLEQLPNFVAFLVAEAKSLNMTVEDYLLKSFPTSNSMWMVGNVDNRSNIEKQYGLDNLPGCILGLGITQLTTAAKVIVARAEGEACEAEALKMQSSLVLPDQAELDRLMKYQSTFQKQVSTIMGELLALINLRATDINLVNNHAA